ncbi:hypothetical protein GOBAR_AA26423 [Gossypium barbadense]|uniref:Uncharacterized protein n=1 Tax=Gossypium barbadense TaxID=3634 RepID=A0A2P5WT32_GOSBA|nr:hypothetical protein GOBAR_AA26423 [Gossypium barbadense]
MINLRQSIDVIFVKNLHGHVVSNVVQPSIVYGLVKKDIEQRERASKCMWCNWKDQKAFKCPTYSFKKTSLQAKERKYDIEPIKKSSSTTIIDDNDINEKETSSDTFVKTGLKGDDNSCKKTKRQEVMSDKSQFNGPILVSENSYEVKLERSIHIEKENGKEREKPYEREE